MDTPPGFSTFFSKKYNFYDFLSTNPFQKEAFFFNSFTLRMAKPLWVLAILIANLLLKEKIFPLRARPNPIKKGGTH